MCPMHLADDLSLLTQTLHTRKKIKDSINVEVAEMYYTYKITKK